VQGSEARVHSKHVGWILGFAVAATIAGQPVGDEQVAHWQAAKGSRQQAFEFLVRANWVEQEAQQRNVQVSPQDAEDAAEGERPTNGLTHEDLVYAERVELLKIGINEQIGEPAARSVTPDQVKAYVDANPKFTNERRKIRLVRATTRHRAALAKEALDHGLGWKQAARRFGGGGTTTVDPLDFPKKAEKAIFKAQRNKTTRVGAIVFKVTEIIPPRPLNRARQEALAWETLSSEAQQEAIDSFNGAFNAKWQGLTNCAPEFQASSVCGLPPRT